MSISQMTAVWNQSSHAANDLLLMLALADAANDDGYCWPSIETLCKKTRLSKATVIRRLAEIETAGEVYINRNRRRGNRYLIVIGLAVEHIAELKEKYFGQSAISSKVRQQKSQNDTSRSRKLRHDKSQLETSEVSPVRHDPSITIIEPSVEPSNTKDSGAQPATPIVAAPPAPAQAEIAPKQKRARASKQKVDKPKTPRDPNPAFDVIAERLFNAPPGSPALRDKNLCARVGMVKSALHDTEILIGEFLAACDWYRRANPGISLPRDPGKVVTMVLDYRAGHKADTEVVYANGMTRAQANAESARIVAEYRGEDPEARTVLDAIMNGTYQTRGATA